MITGHLYHKDSFGQLQSVIVGGSTWTPRLVRSTKIALPHIAKNDIFTYKCQFNHEKTLQENLDDFHIHIIPIGAVTQLVTITFNYGWAWLKNGDYFPNTFTNTGTASIDIVAGDQYRYMIKSLLLEIPPPLLESYSSEIFLEFTRRNDGTDTYAGEFALVDGDAHYPTNHLGSYNRLNDNHVYEVNSNNRASVSDPESEYLYDKTVPVDVLINPNNYDTTVVLEYSTDNTLSIDVSTLEHGDTLTGNVDVSVQFLIPKLNPNNYYYRIKATNMHGETLSDIKELDILTGTGSDRTITDYSTAFEAAKATYVGYTYYIDPSAETDGSGTELSPYNTWSSVPFVSNNVNWLQKSGTTAIFTSGFKSINANNVHIGTYGGTERAKILVNNTYTQYFIESRKKLIIENFEIENTYQDENGQYGGSAIRVRDGEGSWIYNCKLHGFGGGVLLSPTSLNPVVAWKNCKILFTEVYDMALDGLFINCVSDIEIAHCYIHHVNLMYHYNTSEAVSPGDGIQIQYTEVADGDYLRFNIHHNTIDRRDSGNKFCLIFGAGTLVRKYEGLVKYNEFMINSGTNQSGVYAAVLNVGSCEISHNDFIGMGSGNGIFSEETDAIPIIVENNIFKDFGMALGMSRGSSAVTKNTIINCDYAFGVYSAGGTHSFIRNIVISSDSSDRLIYGTDYAQLVSSDYNCYNLTAILTSYPTLANYRSFLEMDDNSIDSSANLTIDYRPNILSPCADLNGDYVGAYAGITTTTTSTTI